MNKKSIFIIYILSILLFVSILFKVNIDRNNNYCNLKYNYFKYLDASVKIVGNYEVGSGTIIYNKNNESYVISCRHLVEKMGNYIIEWNQEEYPAKILYYDKNGYDVSLLKFTSGKSPFIPIAKRNKPLKRGELLVSVGCDNASDPNQYEVILEGARSVEGKRYLTTSQNSPVPGRSGGGLMRDNDLIGICSGTSKVDGTGIGYFIPLVDIHASLKRNGYGWLIPK
jgi:hypothetical protein